MSYVGPYSLVIPNGVKANGSTVFGVLDPDSGGAATFSVPLSADGQEPATYWGCRTLLESSTYTALTTMDTTTFMAYVNNLAITRGRGQVSGVSFKNSLQIGGPDFWTFIASLGLQRVTVAI